MTWSRFITVLLIMIVMGLSYYLQTRQTALPVPIAPMKEQAAFSGKALRNTSYNDKGMRSYRIDSASLKYFASNGDSIFESPTLVIYRDGDIIEWRISASQAVLDEHQQLTLYDKVRMENLLPNASFTSLATNKLVIDLTNRNFNADQPVTLKGPLFETRGKAMKGNLNANNATLYNTVQGRYEVHTP